MSTDGGKMPVTPTPMVSSDPAGAAMLFLVVLAFGLLCFGMLGIRYK